MTIEDIKEKLTISIDITTPFGGYRERNDRDVKVTLIYDGEEIASDTDSFSIED